MLVVQHLERYLTYFEGNLAARDVEGNEQRMMTNEGPSAVKEAIEACKKMNPAGQMLWSDGLWKAARFHV
jgi:hypothetical protein